MAPSMDLILLALAFGARALPGAEAPSADHFSKVPTTCACVPPVTITVPGLGPFPTPTFPSLSPFPTPTFPSLSPFPTPTFPSLSPFPTPTFPSLSPFPTPTFPSLSPFPTPTFPSWSHSPSTSPTSQPPTPSPTAGGACKNVKPFCRANGFDAEYYANNFGGYSRGDPPSNYYIVEGLRPLKTSATNLTYFPANSFDDSDPRIYPNASIPTSFYFPGWTRETNGGIVVDANNFTMVYSGLYRAGATGRHTVCTKADNEADIYFGHDNAFSCLTGKPGTAADPLVKAFGGADPQFNCTTVDLVQGLSYPVRNVMGNWQGPSSFDFTIQPPGGAAADRFDGLAFGRECGLFL